jgi:hypothetical protein
VAYRKEAAADAVRERPCPRCGAPTLRCRVGRTAALDAVLDPWPVCEAEEDFARMLGGLTWCIYDTVSRETRIKWRCPGYAACDHDRVRDHICYRDEKRIMDDLFDTPAQTPAGKTPLVETEENPYKGIPDPVTGKKRRWSRASSYAKTLSDDFMISQWQQRNVVVGMSRDPELGKRAEGLDVKEDRNAVQAIAEAAKKEANSGEAAHRGTELHTFTEYADTGRMLEVPEEDHGRMAEYLECLADLGIEVVPQYMERITATPELGVIGRFDRLVKFEGRYVILDLKTGSSLKYALNEHAIQLAVYANGVDQHGLWDEESGKWTPAPEDLPIDTATGLVVHLPAKGTGCEVFPVDLLSGWQDAELALKVKKARARKPAMEPLVRPVKDWTAILAARIPSAESRKELEEIALLARDKGVWGEQLHAAASIRLTHLTQTA